MVWVAGRNGRDNCLLGDRNGCVFRLRLRCAVAIEFCGRSGISGDLSKVGDDAEMPPVRRHASRDKIGAVSRLAI